MQTDDIAPVGPQSPHESSALPIVHTDIHSDLNAVFTFHIRQQHQPTELDIKPGKITPTNTMLTAYCVLSFNHRGSTE